MRPLKPGETMKRRRGGAVEYFDSLGRNTYYCNREGKWVNKEWVRLPNGLDYETRVQTSGGYWRIHHYDIHTGKLLSELDSKGEKNLIDKRRQWNINDTQISAEIGEPYTGSSHQLF